MENAISAGLSRQIVLARALDVTANNIANQTTAGFKADHVSFREYLARLNTADITDTDVSLVFDPDSYTDFSAGGVESTGAPLDFAISGDGFFGIETTTGVQYTRDGRFGLNDFSELVTRDGDLVLDAGGGPILIDPDAGPILVARDGELQQDGAPIGRLGVYEFDDNRLLRKTTSNLFATDETPTLRDNPVIQQGFVERSNVQPIVAMTDMIEIVRAYESAAQLLETSNDLARDTVRTLTQNA
ncbi:MAG: flagellar hook-basal body complex protein [Pseudomonadota bacterium]